ncbi:hypothetical protein Rsub_07723 [Raphidocelis subcapitata]|uniref:Uncharacterized protein n=1 Tax=Raphidocelis subcapitata TaxID=307507 RepID=A0A2V0P6D6_9CHLO|nr:hypothetical protein Rsub_07723 [Raphidocelis subcapitata]|eukprot:GBF95139.1 hypothetical protein Rsub_07723 [Raphidocelis subcapitata]
MQTPSLSARPQGSHAICRPRSGHASAIAPPRPRRAPLARSVPERVPTQQLPAIDARKLTELFAQQPMEDDERAKLERIARALGVTQGEAKTLAFKKRALLELEEADLASRVDQIAEIVGVPRAQAQRMAAIQPNLLLEPKRNSDALALGLRAICYELDCPKDEAVALILDNRSILHGREMHLSVADIAHLAMLRQPRGRIVD